MAVRMNVGARNAQIDDFIATYANAVGAVYSGVQPTTAALTETANGGTLLGYITDGGGAFTQGSPTNGLNWVSNGDGTAGISGTESWIFMPVASGTPGYCRFYDNSMVTGASTSAVRFDIACGVGTGQLRFAYSTVTVGVGVPISECTVTAPAE